LENLVLRHGFVGFTMDELAARTHCSKSTLYGLSPSKESLVTMVIRRFFAATDRLVERQISPIRSQRERIAVYLTALGHALARMSAECYTDIMSLPATREIYEATSAAAAARVHLFIEMGVDVNEFRATNAKFIGKAVSLLMDGIQHGALLEETGLSSGDAYAELGNLLLGALGSRPAMDLPSEPFVPSDRVGPRPDLPRRVAFASLGHEQSIIWGESMRAAAEARGLEYRIATADFDSETNIRQIREFVNEGVAAMLVVVLNAPAQRPAILEAMEAGVAVFTVAVGPGTSQIVTDQYAVGQAAAQAMVNRIVGEHDGQAGILMFNLDDRESIRPRYQAVRNVVAAAGSDIKILVDRPGTPNTTEFGYEVMRDVIQSHPNVNVVIGEDAHILGALQALQEAGVERDPRWLLVGIGGQSEALAAVSDETTPFHIDVSFAVPAIGAIPGRFADDWLSGRAIPEVTHLKPIVLNSSASVRDFLADTQDPELLFRKEKRHKYFEMLGNVRYRP